MRNVLSQSIFASKMVLRKRRYFTVFLLLIPTIAFLLFLIPVKAIPGNDMQFQLRLFQITDYLLLVTLAILESLLIVMFVYNIHHAHNSKKNLKLVTQGNLGAAGGVFSFLFGTKLCPMCIAVIFGALGPGAVLFAIEFRQWVFIASAAVLLLSIYSTSKQINGTCERCK